MRDGKPDDAWTRFALSIFKLNGLIMRAGDTITQSIGQSKARWQGLGRAYEPQTVADMAPDNGQARPGVQRITEMVAAEGVVGSKNHPPEPRKKVVESNAQGLR